MHYCTTCNTSPTYNVFAQALILKQHAITIIMYHVKQKSSTTKTSRKKGTM